MKIVRKLDNRVVQIQCTEDNLLDVLILIQDFGGVFTNPFKTNKTLISGRFPNEEQAKLFKMSYELEYGEEEWVVGESFVERLKNLSDSIWLE